MHTNTHTQKKREEKNRLPLESGCHDSFRLSPLIEHVAKVSPFGPFSSHRGIGFVNEVAKLPDGSIDMAGRTGQCLRATLPLHPLLSIKPLSS